MNKNKKIRLLLVPLLFVPALFIPEILIDCFSNVYLIGDAIYYLFALPFAIALLIWRTLFDNMPIGVYIAILVVYTAASWIWILRKKKGNAVFFIVWVALCVLSIFLYWELGPEYSALAHE